MSENTLYKEEIRAAILKLKNDQNKVEWNAFIVEMKDVIINSYCGKTLSLFAGDWKRRFKTELKTLNCKCERILDNLWLSVIEEELKRKMADSRSSSSTNSTNKAINENQLRLIISKFDEVAEKDKWILSTGTVVNDVMRDRVVTSKYEHPVHSGILDLSDPIWEKHFTSAERKEMSAFRTTPLAAIPTDLDNYLNQYESLATATDIRKFIFSHYNDPNTEFEKKWAQESFLAASNLFNFSTKLDVSNFSEADLLHKVWCFVPSLFDDDQEIDAKLGEKCSVTVAISKNSSRALELDERRPRKNMGAKLDILFKSGLIEVGSCEIEKADVVQIDDKYLDDGMVKLPKTLRDMLCALVKKNPAQMNELKTVGFLMMGLSMEILIMDVPVGSFITRIRRSVKFDFPESISCLAIDLIPLLQMTWKSKEEMKELLRVLNDRKRKSAAMLDEEDGDAPTLLIPSFYDCI